MNNALSLLQADRLSVTFPAGNDWLRAVEDVSFHLAPGETLALVGESGGGFSATAMAGARLHGPQVHVTGHLGWTTREGASLDLATLRGEGLRRLRGRDIALALAGESRLLVADEPTTALYVTIQAQSVELLQDLLVREGMAMIFVSHALSLVAGLAHRIPVLYPGPVVEEGPAAEMLAALRHP